MFVVCSLIYSICSLQNWKQQAKEVRTYSIAGAGRTERWTKAKSGRRKTFPNFGWMASEVRTYDRRKEARTEGRSTLAHSLTHSLFLLFFFSSSTVLLLSIRNDSSLGRENPCCLLLECNSSSSGSSNSYSLALDFPLVDQTGWLSFMAYVRPSVALSFLSL